MGSLSDPKADSATYLVASSQFSYLRTFHLHGELGHAWQAYIWRKWVDHSTPGLDYSHQAQSEHNHAVKISYTFIIMDGIIMYMNHSAMVSGLA